MNNQKSEVIKIRTAEAHDAPAIVNFQIEMALETEGIQLVKATVENGVSHLFDQPEKGWYWIAENDSHQIIACCMTLREWSDWRNGSVLWLHSVYVVPHARNRGVFNTMYLYLKNYVEQNEKLRGIRLYVDKTNLNAIKVYERNGMNGEHYQLFEWMKG